MPSPSTSSFLGSSAAAVTSSSATLAIIIPPSIPMILYAVMAETSVVQLFVAGIIPGILGGVGMMALAYWYVVRYNYPVEEVFSWQRVKSTFKDAAWAFLLPLIILGGIFGGVVTATEGAALAVLAALLIGGVIYRELDLIKVKGKDEAVNIYEALGPEAALGKTMQEELKLRNQALRAYRSQQWDQADIALLNLQRMSPGRELYRIYAAKVADKRRNPPPQDWDGVTAFDEK